MGKKFGVDFVGSCLILIIILRDKIMHTRYKPSLLRL